MRNFIHFIQQFEPDQEYMRYTFFSKIVLFCKDDLRISAAKRWNNGLFSVLNIFKLIN